MSNNAGIPAGRKARTVACHNCTLFQLCLPVGVGAADLDLLDRILKNRRMVKRGDHVFRPGDAFHAVYAVRSGSVKTYARSRGGRAQMTGFHLPGELIGLDAIDSGVHHCGARALESTSVCELPFDRLEALGTQVAGVQRQMLRIMSKQILHDQVLRTAPIVDTPTPYAAIFNFNWLSAGGTACAFATVAAAITFKVSVGEYFKLLGAVLKQ